MLNILKLCQNAELCKITVQSLTVAERKNYIYLLFQKADLLLHSRKLIHEGAMKWISARGKPIGKIMNLLSVNSSNVKIKILLVLL